MKSDVLLTFRRGIIVAIVWLPFHCGAFSASFQQSAELLPTSAIHNQFNGFGASVAISGTRAAVAEVFSDEVSALRSSAVVYNRGAAGGWDRVATVEIPQFNPVVALDGGTLIVGGDSAFTGHFHVYTEGPPETWSNSVEFMVQNFAGSDRALALSGDVAVVGAREGRNVNELAAGYIFERDQSGAWTESAILRPDGFMRPPLGFGEAVDISGDTVIAGAYGAGSKGAAYVFKKNGAGTWSQVATLEANDGADDDLFGATVAIDGDIAIVGAIADDDGGPLSGSAYIFRRSAGDTWSQVAKLTASDGVAGAWFGWSVDVDGDRAIVGAYDAFSFDLLRKAGTAYVFRDQGSDNWTQTQKLNSIGAQTDDKFGWSVGLSSLSAIIGAPGRDGTFSDGGAAYIFEAVPEPSSWIGIAIGLGCSIAARRRSS